MKIVVIGGTGSIGSKLAALLRDRGQEVVAASPSEGGDTITGAGLADALAGAAVVVDVANAPSFKDRAVMDFFQTSGRNLLAAEAAAGVGHHVVLSIVNTDQMPDNGYFRAKVEQERLVAASGIPHTIVRTAQCMEFLGAHWRLDEVFIRINGVQHYLWRAVGQDGVVLDILVQSRRNTKAAKRFFKKLLKGLLYMPRVIVTDGLKSYGAAKSKIIPWGEHRQSRYLNNRAENSHQPTRQHERRVKRFKSPRPSPAVPLRPWPYSPALTPSPTSDVRSRIPSLSYQSFCRLAEGGVCPHRSVIGPLLGCTPVLGSAQVNVPGRANMTRQNLPLQNLPRC